MTSSFDKTAIIVIEARMLDQSVVIGAQGKEILPFGIRQYRPAKHLYSVWHKKIGDNSSWCSHSKTGYVKTFWPLNFRPNAIVPYLTL